jgi:hypothetical protein
LQSVFAFMNAKIKLPNWLHSQQIAYSKSLLRCCTCPKNLFLWDHRRLRCIDSWRRNRPRDCCCTERHIVTSSYLYSFYCEGHYTGKSIEYFCKFILYKIEYFCKFILYRIEYFCNYILYRIEYFCKFILYRIEYFCNYILYRIEHFCKFILYRIEYFCKFILYRIEYFCKFILYRIEFFVGLFCIE